MPTAMVRPIFAAVVLVVLAGCQTMTDPQRARVVASPTTPIVKTMTNFSNSLRCMDDLLLSYGKRDILITSDGIPDETGQVTLGTKEIMISTLSKMSTKSGAFRFIDVENSGDAVFWIQQNWVGTKSVSVPDYYIRGSITQADMGVATDNQGAGIALPFMSLGYSQDQMLALISIDMNMGDVRNRQILPGLHTSNTITVVRSGSGGDAEGIIGKGSIYLEVSQDRSQGSHQSVRTLIELSLIEVMGKFTKTPYWRCLEIEATDPEIMTQTRDWYDQLDEVERIRLTQAALTATGDYTGPQDGTLNRELRDAINRYKAKTDLIADGRIDFDLYFSFLSRNIASSHDKAHAAQAGSTSSGVQQASASPPPRGDAGPDPIGLQVRPLNTGGTGITVNEPIRFQIVTQQPADVYCYYQAINEPVARIFPSRFQPSARVEPGKPVTVPSDNAGFAIRPALGGVEQVACLATPKPYTTANRPPVLLQGDLVGLQGVAMFEVINQHQTADTAELSVQHISFRVRPKPGS